MKHLVKHIKETYKKLIDKFDTWMSSLLGGDKSDEFYDYEAAVYNILLNEATDEDFKIKEKFEKNHPTEAAETFHELRLLVEAGKHLSPIQELRFVKPNRHVGTDIFKHPIAGCYEHQD